MVFTRDKAVIRKLDSLVNEFPDVYKCIGETDIDKTYSMPKQYVSYRKPRRISEELRKKRNVEMCKYNKSRNNYIVIFSHYFVAKHHKIWYYMLGGLCMIGVKAVEK